MARNTTPNRRLNGLYPLAYLGDNPTTPSDFYSLTRDPTVNDYQGFAICDMWLNTTTYDCWLLVNLAGTVATWIKFTSGGGGNLEKILTDSGTAIPVANQIDLFATPTAGSSTSFSVTAPNIIRLNVTDTLSNTLIGLNAGNATLTGTGNTSLGQSTLNALTSGVGNTAIGILALMSNTTGSANTALGFSALDSNTTASNNTAVGWASQILTTTGANNTSVGSASLASCTTGGNNTCVGFVSQQFLTTGTQNTSVGSESATHLTTAALNTAIGAAALFTATTSGANTAIGSNALNLLTTGSGGNTAVGNGAAAALTTGSSNVSIGQVAHQALLTGVNNIALGSAAGNAYAGAESNNIVIGNVGVLGESNQTRIGTVGTQANCFIAGNIIGYNTAVASNAPETLILNKSRSGGTIVSGDAIGYIYFQGNDGTNYVQSGLISVDSTGVVATGKVAGNMGFWTAPASTGTLTARVGISSTGNVTINAPDSGIAINSISTYGQAVGATKQFVIVDSAGNFGSTNALTSSYFIADISADITNVTGNGTNYVVVYDRTYKNVGSNFNTTTGLYTAPVTGLYQFSSTITFSNLGAAMTGGLTSFVVAGTGVCVGTWALTRSDVVAVQDQLNLFWRFNGSISLFLNAGDTVGTVVQVSGGPGDTVTVSVGGGGPPNRTWFTGYLVSQ